MPDNRELITVTFAVDRDALNAALGNTRKPTAREALQEALGALVTDGLPGGCGCGCNCFEPDPLPLAFEVLSQ